MNVLLDADRLLWSGKFNEAIIRICYHSIDPIDGTAKEGTRKGDQEFNSVTNNQTSQSSNQEIPAFPQSPRIQSISYLPTHGLSDDLYLNQKTTLGTQSLELIIVQNNNWVEIITLVIQ